MTHECRICYNKLEEVFSFGELYIPNFIPMDEPSERYPKAPLDVMYCDNCRLLQLKNSVNPDLLYKQKYWYYSGTNRSMTEALQDVAKSASESIEWDTGDIFLDIASNDGILLLQSPEEFTTVGIDPADEDIINQARRRADYVVNDYFTADNYFQVTDKPAKIITCCAMFYDLDTPHFFLDDVNKVLDDNGLFVIQISYTPLTLRQLELGNFAFEHICYYSLENLKMLLEKHNYQVLDAQLNDVNGASLRVYCMKSGGDTSKFRNQQQRDVAKFRTNSLLSYERQIDLYNETLNFWHNINLLKQKVMVFSNEAVEWAKDNDKRVVGIGASTKASTLTQFFGLDSTNIEYIADRNPIKHGLKCVGTNIPIVSEEAFRKDNPDYALLLIWQFASEVIKREYQFVEQGGKFIVPCPKYYIYPNE